MFLQDKETLWDSTNPQELLRAICVLFFLGVDADRWRCLFDHMGQ